MSGAHRHRRVRRAVSCTALLTAAALGLSAQSAFAKDPGSPPVQQDLESLLQRLHTLYQKSDRSAEQYEEAKDKLEKADRKLDGLTRLLKDQRDDVRRGRREVGLLARRQYIDGNLSDYGKLLASKDPQTAFDQTHILARAADDAVALTRRLRTGEKKLDKLVREQRSTRDRVRRLADKQRKAKNEAKDRLTDVESIVTSLTGAQRDQLRVLEEKGFDAAQAAFLKSGALGKGERAPSTAGRRAVAYAFDQLGDPYVWGAEGPDSFDCSGLTSQAWAHAGHPVPRTSEEQWKQLTRVPLNLLRPGDLVVYFHDASHVAMYIGNGMIVQAPHTGDVVKVSPMGSMPVLGAVRPDPDSPSDHGPAVPEVPPAKKAKPGKGSTRTTSAKGRVTVEDDGAGDSGKAGAGSGRD